MTLKFFLIFFLFDYSNCLVAEWGQCGGWNMSTLACDSCCSCYLKDDFYSQCLAPGNCGIGSYVGWNCSTASNYATTTSVLTTSLVPLSKFFCYFKNVLKKINFI